MFYLQESMCGHRGLELDSDLQVYDMSLTQEFRNHYEKIFSPISDDAAPVGVATRRGEGIDDAKTIAQLRILVKCYNECPHLLL